MRNDDTLIIVRVRTLSFWNLSPSLLRNAEAKLKESIERIRAQPRGEGDGGETGLLEKLVNKYGADSDVPLIMAMDGMGAGIDTTAHTLAFFLYNLATHPDKQELLHREISEVVGDSEEVTEQMLNRMRYLKAATTESMRTVSTTLGTSREGQRAGLGIARVQSST